MIHLVTGGVRSGKSRHAEALLEHHPQVRYVAPHPAGARADDAEWQARVAAHRARRPSGWTTAETLDVPGAVATAGTAVLVDCLGTWVTNLVDDAGLWERRATAHALVEERTHELVAALTAARRDGRDVVVVTNEVGMGLVPAYASGRLFRDALGRVNASVADAADRVALVVAGRVLDLTDAPRVGA